MGRLLAQFHFAVSDLWVASELLGQRWDFDFDGATISLQFPKDNRDFGVDEHSFPYQSPLIGGYTELEDGSRPKTQVRVVRVGVHIDTDFDVPADPTGDETILKVLNRLPEAAEQARRALKCYLDVVGIQLGQHWLGSQADTPQVTWMTRVEREDGTKVPVDYGDPVGLLILPPETALDSSLQSAVLRQVAAGIAPGLPETFLRDAEFFATRSSNAAQTLLYAAIACELKVKHTLRQVAHPDQAALVALVVGKSREFALAVRDLYDKGIEAVVGRSLKKENTQLHKKVNALFEDRNKIAHSGEVPEWPVVRQHVETARQAFAWLNSLL